MTDLYCNFKKICYMLNKNSILFMNRLLSKDSRSNLSDVQKNKILSAFGAARRVHRFT